MRNTGAEQDISLSFLGGAGSVTGANFLLSGEKTNILVDCGLVQGDRFASNVNAEPFQFNPEKIDFLLVTHAHIDHIGRIPKLARDGFVGKIISTPETRELAPLMFYDALNVMKTEEMKEKGVLLYEEADIEKALSLWSSVPYHNVFEVGEFDAQFRDAGHILGSAVIEVGRSGSLESRKIVFTGDLGNSPSPLLRDTEEITEANYLVMESVYGDRNHEGFEERREMLARVISEARARGGALLIPCFSLEKTQTLLFEIDDLLEEKKINPVPVFLDSPLAIKVTSVYRSMSENFNEEAKKQIAGGDDIFDFPKLKLTLRSLDSQAIAREKGPKIIIAGSGMSTGGRILGHERSFLSDPHSTILFVGYQAVGSLGRMIQDGVARVEINGEEIEVRAKVETMTGYSSHKDSANLQKFVERAAKGGALEKVFVTMGEPRASMFLAQRIKDYIGVDAVVPKRGDVVNLRL